MRRVPGPGTVTRPGSALLPLSLQGDTRRLLRWQPGVRGEKPFFTLCFKEIKESTTRPWTCQRCQWLLGTFCFAPLWVFSRAPSVPEWSGGQGRGSPVQLPRGHRAASPKSAHGSHLELESSHGKFGMGGRCSKPQTEVLSMKLRELYPVPQLKGLDDIWHLFPILDLGKLSKKH